MKAENGDSNHICGVPVTRRCNNYGLLTLKARRNELHIV
jgi:hypothetical protein